MPRIEKTKPKNSSGGYGRLFGITELGQLMTRVQSAVISAGTELERIITAKVEKIENLDDFLKQERMPEGVMLATKRQIKKCTTLDFPGAEPDFLIFKRRQGRQNCYVVELKDGHVFDTKKASAEWQAIHSFIESNAQNLQCTMSAHFCCFNQDSKDAILTGFKNRISKQEAMTEESFANCLNSIMRILSA